MEPEIEPEDAFRAFEELSRFSIEEIAASLTYLKMNLYRTLSFAELTDMPFYGRTERHPHVQAAVAEFNSLTAAVSLSILQPELRQRVAVAGFWAQLADALISAGNLESGYAVALGLCHTSVARLQWTFRALAAGPQAAALARVVALDASNRRQTSGQEAQAGARAVPLLSTLITDLTFVWDGNAPGVRDEKIAQIAGAFVARCEAWPALARPAPLNHYQQLLLLFGCQLGCDSPILEALWHCALLSSSPIHRLLARPPAADRLLYERSLRCESRDCDLAPELEALLPRQPCCLQ